MRYKCPLWYILLLYNLCQDVSSCFYRFGTIFLFFVKKQPFWTDFCLIFTNYWKFYFFHSFLIFLIFCPKQASNHRILAKKRTHIRVFTLLRFSFISTKYSKKTPFRIKTRNGIFYTSSSRIRLSFMRSIIWSLYSSSPLSKRRAAP